jgi:CheY-like chemotaxis protein
MSTPAAGNVILIVEDNEDDVFLMENALAMAEVKARLEVVRDGQEALHYLSGTAQFADRERFPFPGVILLDLKLPYRSGLDILAWMRQETNLPSAIVVVLTSSDEPADLKTAYGLGANTYLVKPPTVSMICDILTTFKLDWLRSNASHIQNK